MLRDDHWKCGGDIEKGRPDTHTRRGLLAGAACSGVVLLAGCSGLTPFSNEFTAIEANNYTPTERTVVVEAVPEQADDRSSDTLFYEEIALPGNSSGDTAYVDREAFPTQPAVVRVRFEGAARFGITAHHHFVPDCRGRDDVSDRVIIQITGDGGEDGPPVVSFRRSRCESL